MGTDPKPNRRLEGISTYLLIGCAVSNVLLSLSAFYEPKLAAYNIMRPTNLQFWSDVFRRCFIGLILVEALITAFVQSKRRLGAVSCLCSVLLLTVYQIAMPIEKQYAIFLEHFAARVRAEIGARAIDATLLKIQTKVENGSIVGAQLARNDIPEDARRLFRNIPLAGNVNFDNSKVFDIEIAWGGPLFSWGFRAYNQTAEDLPQGKYAIVLPLYTNVVVFIEK